MESVMEAPVTHATGIRHADLPRAVEPVEPDAFAPELVFTTCDCCQQWDFCYTALEAKDGLPTNLRALCRDCWTKYVQAQA